MGIQKGMRVFFKNVPEVVRSALVLSAVEVSLELTGQFDYIHLFTKTQAELNTLFPVLKAHLEPSGMFWVSWPKRKQLETDLSLPEVIRIGYNHGLVESTCLSVDTVWSALKFTHPKEGKIYNNRYGQLPGA